MKQFLFFPLNTISIMIIGLILTFLPFSHYYRPPIFSDVIFYISSLLPYLLYYLFKKDKGIGKIPNANKININTIYRYFVVLSVICFLYVFSVSGIPIMSAGGRVMSNAMSEGGEVSGGKLTAIINILGYCFLICTVLFSAAFGTKKQMSLCIIYIVGMSIIILSRQLTMVCVMVFSLCYISRYSVNFKRVLVIIGILFCVIEFFSILGDYRQKLHGDYVVNYAHFVGASTVQGESINDALYWLWLYIASPVYNMFYNYHSFNASLSPCYEFFTSECQGSFFSTNILPLTISKILNLPLITEKLVVEHLNVSTAYARTILLFGSMGMIIYSILHVFFYVVGMKLCERDMRPVFKIYYSALSFFVIFYNVFIFPHFIAVSWIIIIFSWINKKKFVFR